MHISNNVTVMIMPSGDVILPNKQRRVDHASLYLQISGGVSRRTRLAFMTAGTLSFSVTVLAPIVQVVGMTFPVYTYMSTYTW